MPEHSIRDAQITVCLHSMWCEVQVCRGPGGERLKRADWKPLGRGKLSVDYEPRNDPPGMVGKLVKGHEACAKTARSVFPLAEKASDEPV